nr:PDZ domain-containing protein [Acidobacteriota bacterium]
VPWGSPAFEAGIDEGDVITAMDGKAFTSLAAALKDRKPGDVLAVEFRRPSGQVVKGAVTLRPDPALEAVAVESAGGTLTAAQGAFREAWLGSKAR